MGTRVLCLSLSLLVIAFAGCGTDDAPVDVDVDLRDPKGSWILDLIEMDGEEIDQSDSTYICCYEFTIAKMYLPPADSGHVWLETQGLPVGDFSCRWETPYDAGLRLLIDRGDSVITWDRAFILTANRDTLETSCFCGWYWPQDDMRYYFQWTYLRE